MKGMMKKLIVMLLLAMAVMTAEAQRVMSYQVKRGEDLASIAQRFGMTERELKALNDGLSYCYAGMTIEVKDYRGRGDVDDGYYDDRVDMGDGLAGGWTADPDVAEAQRLEQSGHYKQAVKSYSRAIERNPSVELLFSRGMCYFEMKKWKNAIADLERVSRSRHCPDDLRRSCDDYLDEAYARQDEARERRSNTWAGIAAGVVGVAVVADALSSGGGSKGGKGDKDGHATKSNAPDNKGSQAQKGSREQQKAASGGGRAGGRPQGAEAGQRGSRGEGKSGGQRGNGPRGSGQRDGQRR